MIFSKLKNLWNYISGVENWIDIVMEWFGISVPEFRLYRFRNGLNFVGRPKKIDRGPMHDLLLNHEYDKCEIDSGDVVVDIGAHVGTYSVMAGKKGARVLSIEPDPESFRLLKINLLLNRIQAFAENIALLDKRGHAILKSSNEQSCANSLLMKSERLSYNDIMVPTDTLDNVLKRNGIEHVNILKMDCEGAEYAIIDSLSEKTAGIIDKIILEYHFLDGKRNGQELIETIKAKGFTIDYADRGKMGLILARKAHAGKNV